MRSTPRWGNETLEQTVGTGFTTFAYNNANRLTSIAFPPGSGGGRSTYSYGGDGLRRSAIEAGGVLTTFLWDGSDYLMEKT